MDFYGTIVYEDNENILYIEFKYIWLYNNLGDFNGKETKID